MIPKNEPFLWSDEHITQRLYEVLTSDAVAITTTDTIPGFLAPLTEEGFAALNRYKGGRQGRPYLILIASRRKLTKFIDPCNLTPTVETLVKRCWPGALTLVCKAKKSLPVYLKSAEGTVALRCPQHEGLLALLPKFDGLFSTSANVSGRPAPVIMNDIDASLRESVACVVNARGIKGAGHMPSTILDVSSMTVDETGQEHGHVRLIRAGDLGVETLEAIMGRKILR
jgi:tRNA threonylcarbamoyl adenosine modification protein (Sua5/YciO/YrdC/YwlC family)